MTLEINTLTTPFVFNVSVNCYLVRTGDGFVLIDTGRTNKRGAIEKELLSRDREAMLWVGKDNIPARKVYEKIGFEETEHVLLGFKAKRL